MGTTIHHSKKKKSKNKNQNSSSSYNNNATTTNNNSTATAAAATTATTTATSSTTTSRTTDILTYCLQAVQKSILSVGSGDGSQQEAIVKQGLTKLQVTFYDDSKTTLLKKYPNAGPTLFYLEQTCEVAPRYQVDATKLHTLYEQNSFDLIFFTFPHTGISSNNNNNNDNHRRCIESNQQLLREFLKSASQILKSNGEIQITLKKGEHYERWKLPELLDKNAGLILNTIHPLDKSMFPGYTHRMTNCKSKVSDKKGAQVYVFTPKVSSSLTSSSSPSGSTATTVGDSRATTPTNDTMTMANNNNNTSLDESSSSLSPLSLLFVGKLLTIIQPPPSPTEAIPTTTPTTTTTWTDEDLWMQVNVLLESFCAPTDVLEIRRMLQPIPDTRQLNRILYTMEKQNIVKRHPPGSKNRKPRWTLK